MTSSGPHHRWTWHSTPARDVAIGQVAFAAFIALCVALHPGFVLKANEGGISNYGVHAKTLVPYTLALGLASLFSLRGARSIRVRDGRSRRVRLVLNAYGALMALTLVTTYPYTLDVALKDLHDGVGAVVFAFELVTAAAMVRSLGRRRGVFLVQLAGFVVGAVTFVGDAHLLFAAQVVSGVAYAVILVSATAAWG